MLSSSPCSDSDRLVLKPDIPSAHPDPAFTMSSDNTNSNSAPTDMARTQRRGSVTSAVTSLFRSNSMAQPPVAPFPGSLTSAAMSDQRRRLSITTNTLGLSGTSPSTAASAAFLRRASLSTNSDSIDETAVEDDDKCTTTPVTPFARRMSFGAQAMRGMRNGTSPANNDQGFNWPDQLRSRAESTVAAGSRPSFSFGSGLNGSPPRSNNMTMPHPPAPHHERAKSVSDMPAPPAQAPKARVPQKPDHFQERILKGDFYMD